MKVFFCLWLGLIIVSFGCWEKDYKNYPHKKYSIREPVTFPDKNLSEIRLSGDYSTSGTKEKFEYKGSNPCYYVKKPKKGDILDKNLRARLYDKDGNILTEDFLRVWDTYDKYFRVISYLPYDDNGHEIRIVRLKDNQEVTLETIEFLSESQLKELDGGGRLNITINHGWYFKKEAQCFIPPPYR